MYSYGSWQTPHGGPVFDLMSHGTNRQPPPPQKKAAAKPLPLTLQSLWVNSYKDIKCTGWRRLIGSPKLQVIFHKRATKYRSLLRKMIYKDKGSYESSSPCTARGIKIRHPMNCRSFFAKKPRIIELFWGQWPTKIRHPTNMKTFIHIH